MQYHSLLNLSQSYGMLVGGMQRTKDWIVVNALVSSD